jgi:hypothetical protein
MDIKNYTEIYFENVFYVVHKTIKEIYPLYPDTVYYYLIRLWKALMRLIWKKELNFYWI